ncbi:N-acetylmuramoyl-L-alanine amidase [Domibacillus sp. PGB-M46]|uniref:N-acetylmuramoyl-L-alanine amidase n=1 Tax=Domibacillus sp. PGB-M46 TaxID=2910255 RepID=UPI001F560341|nr:N-acetylmuramoyl-L-alanine amidase [Domibacillus sp. PGB-M46]MCI2254788.1 N-acetylmuramoyl-L-alanine amidase [Domibacillus sp. PGB-M46]
MNKKKKQILFALLPCFILIIAGLVLLNINDLERTNSTAIKTTSPVTKTAGEEEKTVETPEEMPEEMPEETPEETPEEMPEETPKLETIEQTDSDLGETPSVITRQNSIKEESEPEETVVPEAKEKRFLVVIDPGHQVKANLDQEPVGPGATETKYKVTGGTTGIKTGVPEYELNLKAAFLLKAELERRGIQVILTRDSNEVDISNRERAEIANTHKADLFVRLHADGSENPDTKGFSILIPSSENPYTKPIVDRSSQAADEVMALARTQLAINEPGIFPRNDMSGFNWSKVPVILPEIGFMTNPEEDVMLSSEEYLLKVMKVLAEGITNYKDQ